MRIGCTFQVSTGRHIMKSWSSIIRSIFGKNRCLFENVEEKNRCLLVMINMDDEIFLHEWTMKYF